MRKHLRQIGKKKLSAKRCGAKGPTLLRQFGAVVLGAILRSVEQKYFFCTLEAFFFGKFKIESIQRAQWYPPW